MGLLRIWWDKEHGWYVWDEAAASPGRQVLVTDPCLHRVRTVMGGPFRTRLRELDPVPPRAQNLLPQGWLEAEGVLCILGDAAEITPR